MSDDIVVRIKMLLEKASEAELKQAEKYIENKLNPKIKMDLDATNLDKASQKYVDMQNSVSGIAQRTKEWVTSSGEIVKQTEILKTGTSEITKRVTDTTVNYKKQREELEKVANLTHKQSLAQQDLLNRIRGMRGIDGKYIVGDNLSSLNQLEAQILGFDPANKNFSKNMDEANSKLKQITTTANLYKKEVQDANKYTGIFGQSILEAGKKFASWLLIGNVIMGVAGAVRNGIQYITDIDTALTNLNKVTDETKETLKDFSIEANSIGDSLAKTTTDVVNATTEFARLGFSLQQATQLAKQALLYSNVGDIGVEEASLAIISAVKGFGVEVDSTGRNVQKIVDIYNEVGNNFAISSAGIGEAMRRSSASLYAAGNTMEEAVALITSANSVIQDPAAVGGYAPLYSNI